jgi:hypothetical protein
VQFKKYVFFALPARKAKLSQLPPKPPFLPHWVNDSGYSMTQRVQPNDPAGTLTQRVQLVQLTPKTQRVC